MAEDFLYDVAIVGGGLGGLCLAIQCAEEGYNTILFEKEAYPFHKVCGEFVSRESEGFLERIGFDFAGVTLPRIHKLELSDRKGRRYFFPLKMGGIGISRYTLDNSLYRIALTKNVRVAINSKVHQVAYTNDRFTIESSSGRFSAKIAVGSFGKRSNLDVKWNRDFIQSKHKGLNNYIGVKYHIKFPHPEDTIALHNFKNGYCGISAIEDGKCCLCYLTKAQNLKENRNSIKCMENKILYENPALKHIFTNAEFLYDEPLTISQISFYRKTQVENHMLLLGDAAGLITPLCGNGMSMAMRSSQIAFREIRLFFESHSSITKMTENYTRSWNSEFGQRLNFGRVIQQLFGGNTSTEIFLRVMNFFPLLAAKTIDLTHGKPF